jgi:hypothetical protein
MMHAVPLLVVLIALWQGIGSYLGNFFLRACRWGSCMTLRVALFNSPADPARSLFRPEQLRPPDFAHHLQCHDGDRRRPPMPSRSSSAKG